MYKQKKKSIRSKLIWAFAVILLVPSLLIGVTSYMTAKEKVEDQLIQSAKQNVVLLDRLLTSTIEPELRDVKHLASLVHGTTFQGEERNAIQKSLEGLQALHPELIHTFVGATNGQMLLAPYEKLADDYDPRTRLWYKQAVEHPGQIIITEPYVDAASKDEVVTIAVQSDDRKSVVGIDLNLKALAESVKQVKVGNEGYAFLIDGSRKYIVHPTQKPGTEASGSPTEKMFASTSGEFEYEWEGHERRMFFATNKLTGWKVAGTMYVDEAKKEANPIFVTLFVVLAVSFLYGGIRSFFVIRSIVGPLRVLNEAAHRVSEGKLTERIDTHSNDEFGELAESFNHMSDSLQMVLREVQEQSDHLASSSYQLTEGANQTSHATEQITGVIQEVAADSDKQVERIERASGTVVDMSNRALSIAEQARSVTASASQAVDMAEEGNLVLQQAVNQMHAVNGTMQDLEHVIKNLGKRSDEIGKIIEVITTISSQTNLLALNAAIEAARAGEHGRGFAVVADEVRVLAEQSAQSAAQIAALIGTIQQETEMAVQSMVTSSREVAAGMDVVDTAGQLFGTIRGSVAGAASQFREVAVAVEQMAAHTGEIVRVFEGMEQLTSETASGMQTVYASTEEQLAFMQEISASAASLSQMSAELQGLLRKFEIS
ncbi:methyl-accepting chemotaxis protein [Aneurinibacillus uraniidurans]|uniref:methyl-accepting chemotaxis protein n=1 Tax=Aneurinibacillus uraniidurans TaxID=2966586 RepID=UPI00234B644C|nr:methyl-accepting chemotaxis protein [Aneurinibacillus sp. B1]WCN38023.1 methyl-accepting chemotaxis protein [Aneurinibacillus sp. B1]